MYLVRLPASCDTVADHPAVAAVRRQGSAKMIAMPRSSAAAYHCDAPSCLEECRFCLIASRDANQGRIKVVASEFTSTVPSGAVPSEIRGFAPSSRGCWMLFNVFDIRDIIDTVVLVLDCPTRHNSLAVSMYSQPDRRPAGEPWFGFIV